MSTLLAVLFCKTLVAGAPPSAPLDCTLAGDLVTCSDGTSWMAAGSSILGDAGSCTLSGSFEYGGDGGWCLDSGALVSCSNGTSYDVAGSYVTGSDGSSCILSADLLSCWG
jgi:hypothetical protein